MSETTREINRITTTIISVSCKVLVYVLVIFLMYEGITKGYAYGHEVFAPTAVEAPPGRSLQIVIEKGAGVSEVAKILEKEGLIKDRFIFMLQSKFYDYEMYPGSYKLNTSMTSKEIMKLIDGNHPSDEEETNVSE